MISRKKGRRAQFEPPPQSHRDLLSAKVAAWIEQIKSRKGWSDNQLRRAMNWSWGQLGMAKSHGAYLEFWQLDRLVTLGGCRLKFEPLEEEGSR